MPLDRFYHLPEDRRAQLLRVAAAEFAEKGFDGASLNAILASAGLSKGSYYYYFTDKEDLYAEALGNAVEALVKDLPALPSGPITRETFWPAVDRYFRECMKVVGNAAEYAKLVRGLSSARRQSPRFAALAERVGALYGSMIEAGRAAGCVRTDLPAPLLVQLLGAIDAVLDEGLFAERAGMSPEALDRHVTLVLDTFRRVLEPAAHATTPTTKAPTTRTTKTPTIPTTKRRKS